MKLNSLNNLKEFIWVEQGFLRPKSLVYYFNWVLVSIKLTYLLKGIWNDIFVWKAFLQLKWVNLGCLMIIGFFHIEKFGLRQYWCNHLIHTHMCMYVSVYALKIDKLLWQLIQHCDVSLYNYDDEMLKFLMKICDIIFGKSVVWFDILWVLHTLLLVMRFSEGHRINLLGSFWFLESIFGDPISYLVICLYGDIWISLDLLL